MVNLDDTTNCPLADTCDMCGGTNELDIATFDTPIGVICQTYCRTCATTGQGSRIAQHGMELMKIAYAVMDHCQHLGITIEEMAAALEAERPE